MPHATSSDGARIFYEVSGPRDGTPVVMIQGLGADSRGWILQRRAVARSHRVVLVDNRGVGRSDRPPGPYDLEQMATDVIACLDDAGIDRAHVVGASMGGVISQIIAVLHPDRVRSLVLCCTACQHHEWRRELLADWADVATQQGMRALLGRSMRWLIGPRSRRRFGFTMGLLGSLVLATPPESFVAQIEAILAAPDDIRLELANVRVPALVVVGTQDILTPAGDSEELVELLPDAELVLITGAAHGFMVEHARPLNRLLVDFLARVDAGQAGSAADGSIAAA